MITKFMAHGVIEPIEGEREGRDRHDASLEFRRQHRMHIRIRETRLEERVRGARLFGVDTTDLKPCRPQVQSDLGLPNLDRRGTVSADRKNDAAFRKLEAHPRE